jgi:hypothetical protein
MYLLYVFIIIEFNTIINNTKTKNNLNIFVNGSNLYFRSFFI